MEGIGGGFGEPLPRRTNTSSLFLSCSLSLPLFTSFCLSPQRVRLGSLGSRGYIKWMWIWVRKQRCYIKSCSWTKVNKNGALYCRQEPWERESLEKRERERARERMAIT